MRYDDAKNKYYIDRVNLIFNKIEHEIPTRKCYQFLYLHRNGDLYLSYYRSDVDFERDVDILRAKKNQIRGLLDTREVGASQVMSTKDRFYILVGGGSSGPTSFEVYKKTGKFMKSIQIDDDGFLDENTFCWDSKRKLLLFATQEFTKKVDDMHNGFFFLNLMTSSLKKEPFNFDREFDSVAGMAISRKENKLYISPLMSANLKKETKKINNYIYVLSYPEFRFLNKISVGENHYPQDIVYLESVSKLYVNERGLGLSVIDGKTEKVVKRFPIHIVRFSNVGHNKILMSVIQDHKPKLLIWDAKTDRIIKSFDGNYGPVSKPMLSTD